MAEDAWIKSFPHPNAMYAWDPVTEKWVPFSGSITLDEPISVSFFDGRVAVTGFPEDTVWSGLIEAVNDKVTCEPSGLNTFGISVVTWGGWIGVIEFEVSVNGIAYYPCQAVNSSTGEIVTSTSVDGVFTLPCAGYARMRVRCSSYSGGSALATLRGSSGTNVGTIPLNDTQLRATTLNVGDTSVLSELILMRRLLEEIFVMMKLKE